MITTANQGAIAIESARLYQSVRKERDRHHPGGKRRAPASRAQSNTTARSSSSRHPDGHRPYGAPAGVQAQAAAPSSRRCAIDAAGGAAGAAALFELRPLNPGDARAGAGASRPTWTSWRASSFHAFRAAGPPAARDGAATARTIFASSRSRQQRQKARRPTTCGLRLSCLEGWLQVWWKIIGRGFDVDSMMRDL